MSLKESILKELSSAMKQKDKETLKVLRMLHAGIKNKEIEIRPQDLKEADVLAVLKKQIKQTKESLEFSKKSERDEEIRHNEKEISILEAFLPQAPSEEELKKVVLQVIEEIKPKSMKDMGQVMKQAQAKTGGLADGKQLSSLVKTELSKI